MPNSETDEITKQLSSNKLFSKSCIKWLKYQRVMEYIFSKAAQAALLKMYSIIDAYLLTWRMNKKENSSFEEQLWRADSRYSCPVTFHLRLCIYIIFSIIINVNKYIWYIIIFCLFFSIRCFRRGFRTCHILVTAIRWWTQSR